MGGQWVMGSGTRLGIGGVAVMAVGLVVGLGAMGLGHQAQAPTVNTAAQQPLHWARHTPGSQVRVDHAPWSSFLQGTTVEERGVTRVAFSALQGDPRELLDIYIDWLTTLKPSEWDRSEQLAYWLNLHNALTVRAIADAGGRGTVDRVRQFPTAASGPFAERNLMIEGQSLSIDAIVHEVLRPNFADAPFHYGLFTGAKGAPKLRRTAYEGASVGAALDEQGRAFVNSHGVRVSRRALELSSLYEWYAEDFGGSDDAILAHVSGYADTRLKAGLQDRTMIDGYRYDLAVATVIPRRYEPQSSLGFGGSGALFGGQQPSVGGGS